MNRSLYRARQFGNVFRARLSQDEWRTVEGHLSPALFALFMQMPRMDQRHSTDVFSALEQAGCQDPDVLTAALLHDVGKGRVHVGHRVVFVLMSLLAPVVLRAWAADRSGPWRRALYRLDNHEELGARLAAGAGASPTVVTLIRNEEQAGSSYEFKARLSRLRAADEAH